MIRYLVLAASLLLLGPASAQTVSGCSSVAANRVATSKDVVKLQADADCFARAGETASAAREVRLDRIAALAPKPVPTPAPTPTPTPIAPPKAPDGFGFCAREGEVCQIVGRNDVRYGVGDRFATATKDGAFVCGNNLFGDPANGVVKACFYRAAPVAETTPATTPTLAGLAPIASSLNVASLLQPSWGTGAIATKSEDGEGAFRFICYAGQLRYDDPVIFPGQPGKSHLHQFFGNTKADAFSTFESLRTTGDSTCDNALNRSAYWIPAMMNGAGKVVQMEYASIYYKGLPPTSPLCAQLGKACVRIPRGLRYVFGYNMQNPAASAPADTMWWNCDAPNKGGHFPSLAVAIADCPVGAKVGMVLTGPGCWNGKDLDSADHRSHMAFSFYENGKGRCPTTHPYVIPHFTIGSWWTVDATAKSWYLASDRMAGMPDHVAGSTLHADWFGAWEDEIMETWHANCIDKLLSCAGGDLGNGTQMQRNALSREPTVRVVDAPVQAGG